MTTTQIGEQLREIPFDDNFPAHSAELIDAWSVHAVGIEAVEVILRFIEAHPSINYGAPGPLVHFAERFYGAGYEEQLLASLKRRPTGVTMGMLNALINRTRSRDARQELISALRSVESYPSLEQFNRQLAARLLVRLAKES